MATKKIALVLKRCIRCNGATVPYAAARFYCLKCGFTFHKDSTDETDELVRRQVSMVKK